MREIDAAFAGGCRATTTPRLHAGGHRRRAVSQHFCRQFRRGQPPGPAPFRAAYFLSGEINTPVADVPAKLTELEERFGPEGEVSHLDGLSVEAEDWQFNVRPSNTEPLLRLNLEARSPELMERKRDEVLAVIREP
jgi:hypothetical protein